MTQAKMGRVVLNRTYKKRDKPINKMNKKAQFFYLPTTPLEVNFNEKIRSSFGPRGELLQEVSKKQLLCGFICVYHPVAPGSNPKHTIYAFFN